MSFKEYRYAVLSDLYRIERKVNLKTLVKQLLIGEAYKYIFWMRTCKFLRSYPLLKYSFYPFARLMLRRYKFRLGIDIPLSTAIGNGFYIGHFGGIVVNGRSQIGDNVNLSPGVILGRSNRGGNKGFPILGNNVYVGPGVKIVGAVRIGNNVAIGANSVVVKDIPDNAVAAGIPAKVLSFQGAEGYVNKTDYHEFIVR